MNFSFGKLICATALAAYFAAPGMVMAVDPVVTGTWILNYRVNNGADYPNQTHTFVQSGGSITGSGGGGNYTWQITGTIQGAQITFTDQYNGISYHATSTGSTDGNTMLGTWNDSNGVSGTFNGARSNAIPTPKPTVSNIDPETGKRKSATRILCNRGPQPGDDFACTATVGSFDGGPPSPSGTVKFTADKGGFRYGDTCLLSASPSSGNTSSCRVIYINTSIGAGTVVPVDAEYAGDVVYAKSTSTRIKSTVVRLPKKPLVCFSEEPGACNGLNAIIPPGISSGGIGNVTVSYYGSQNGKGSSPVRYGVEAASLKSPKRKGSIALNVQFIIKQSDNAALNSLEAAKPLAKQLKNGLVIGTFKTQLKFGETKRVFVKLKPAAKNLLADATTAQLASLNLKVKVESVRQGDSKPKVVTRSNSTALQN